MFSSLPTVLLALLFSLPILSAQTCPYDPFRQVSVHVPKVQDHPVCCLKPLPSSLEHQSSEEELLLSFEDWKKAKLIAQELKTGGNNGSSSPTKSSAIPHHHDLPPDGADGTNISVDAIPPSANPLAPPALTEHGEEYQQQPSPHFRVPLTDRFNYANVDCSARVHMAHRSAKGSTVANILSSKKDRYMLSPCSGSGEGGGGEGDGGERQFVVVELCEDIRIDTVQLANFEFFSGVFKDISVAVAKTYAVEPEGWIEAGRYRAKNVRGVQSFHPPTSLRDFYRYIRIDFHSHYGNEYYCPISLLRVFGLTHLEEWKWDMWEAESREKILQRSGAAAAAAAASASSDVESASALVDSASAVTAEILLHHTESLEVVSASETLSLDSSHTDVQTADNSFTTAHELQITTTSSLPVSRTMSSITSLHDTLSSADITLEASHHFTDHTSSGDSLRASTSTTTSTISLSSSSSIQPHISSTGGESIYRTIMNRLTVLETNTTLYTRYVEEQTAGVREVLRRLGEDVGRLEGIGKAQAQMYQRTLGEMERQRRRLELEHGELMSRVNYLAEEVIMEKRLGIAQLGVLVAVLVFMTLTRGSRGELDHASSSSGRTTMSRGDSWGQRTLSFSGDWVGRFRSRSPVRKVKEEFDGTSQIEFPKRRVSTPPPPLAPTHVGDVNRAVRTSNTSSTPGRRSFTHPKTPQSRSTASRHSKSTTGDIPPIPKSAAATTKKWSRSTAHIHEFKNSPSRLDARLVGGSRTASPLRTNNAAAFTTSTTATAATANSATAKGNKGTGNGESDDVDLWVDTDDTASDAEFVIERTGTGRFGQRQFLVAAAS